MTKTTIIPIFILLLLLSLTPKASALEWDKSTVASSNGDNPVSFANQDRLFWSNELLWLVYGQEHAFYYKTSSDGETWSSEQDFASAQSLHGFYLAVTVKDGYVHYGLKQGIGTYQYYLFYRKGQLNDDGSITWVAPEQTVLSNPSHVYVEMSDITVDSNGCPWIAYYYYVGVDSYSFRITKSSLSNGTWSTAEGFPYTMVASSIPQPYCGDLETLGNGNIFASYMASDFTLKGKLYSGSWGSLETISSLSIIDPYDAVVVGNDLYYFYEDDSYQIQFNKRTFGVGWGTDGLIEADGGVPAVTVYDNAFYLFYIRYNATALYFTSADLSNLTSWATSITVDSDYTGGYDLLDLVAVTSNDDFVGVAYSMGDGKPFDIIFSALDTTPPETVNDYDNLWHTSDFFINLTATDDYSGVAETFYRINDGPRQNVTADGQPFINTEGTDNSLTYWSVDNVGNEEMECSLTNIRLDKTDPMGFILIMNGASYTNVTAVTLNLSATDATSGVAQMRFSNDSITWTPWETYSAFKAWLFTAGDGTKTVYVQYVDHVGLSSPSYQGTIILDQTGPIANAGQDQTVNLGAAVTFDASGSTDNYVIVSYVWDFGDGTSGIGKTATHEYTKVGTYTATLTLKDAAGNKATDTLNTSVVTIGENTTQIFPWWLVAAGGIVAASVIVAVVILWRRRKKA